MKYISFFVFVILFACSDQFKDIPEPDSSNFYPLSISRTYRVTEFQTEITGTDTLQYFLRERIVDTLQNGDNISFILSREKRNIGVSEWKLDSLWTLRKDDKNLIIRENGIDRVKLVFPMTDELSWDQNAYSSRNRNIIEANLLEANELDSLSQLDTLNSEFAYISILDEELNTTGKKIEFEIYAKDIGLVFKFRDIINSQSGIVEKGRYLNQRLVAYE